MSLPYTFFLPPDQLPWLETNVSCVSFQRHSTHITGICMYACINTHIYIYNMWIKYLDIWMTLCSTGVEIFKDRRALVFVHSWGLLAVWHLCRGPGQKPGDLLVGRFCTGICRCFLREKSSGLLCSEIASLEKGFGFILLIMQMVFSLMPHPFPPLCLVFPNFEHSWFYFSRT